MKMEYLDLITLVLFFIGGWALGKHRKPGKPITWRCIIRDREEDDLGDPDRFTLLADGVYVADLEDERSCTQVSTQMHVKKTKRDFVTLWEIIRPFEEIEEEEAQVVYAVFLPGRVLDCIVSSGSEASKNVKPGGEVASYVINGNGDKDA